MKTSTLILTLIILGLSSCDKSSTLTKKVTNSSDYDLLLYTTTDDNLLDSISIQKGETKQILTDQSFHKVKGYSNCKGITLTRFIDSVKITSFSNKELTIDINSSDKWMFNIENKDLMGYGTCNCELTIVNSDIQ